MLVLLEVLGQVLDALGEKSNLNLRRSSVTGVSCVFVDDRLLDICFKCHVGIPFLSTSLRGAHDLMSELSLSAAVRRQPHKISREIADLLTPEEYSVWQGNTHLHLEVRGKK